MEATTEVEEVLGAEASALDVPVNDGDHAARPPRETARNDTEPTA